MKLKYWILYFFLSLIFTACGLPKNFTNYYLKTDTGLNERIDIEGVYAFPFQCDSSFYTLCMFYHDGLFLSATTDTITNEILSCFERNNSEPVKSYPLWGTYRIEGDTIKTQSIRQEGNGCVIFRNFVIVNKNKIINTADYVESQHTNLAYMKNYPSFFENTCPSSAKFIPLKTRRNPTDCPFMKNQQFYGK